MLTSSSKGRRACSSPAQPVSNWSCHVVNSIGMATEIGKIQAQIKEASEEEEGHAFEAKAQPIRGEFNHDDWYRCLQVVD